MNTFDELFSSKSTKIPEPWSYYIDVGSGESGFYAYKSGDVRTLKIIKTLNLKKCDFRKMFQQEFFCPHDLFFIVVKNVCLFSDRSQLGGQLPRHYETSTQ